jgi:hypothetical protein
MQAQQLAENQVEMAAMREELKNFSNSQYSEIENAFSAGRLVLQTYLTSPVELFSHRQVGKYKYLMKQKKTIGRESPQPI